MNVCEGSLHEFSAGEREPMPRRIQRSASAECKVSTAKGIVKTINVRRKNAHGRWTAENTNTTGGTPWKLHPEADEVEVPKYQEREKVPRRVMITASVVGRFGPSTHILTPKRAGPDSPLSWVWRF